MQVIYYGGGRGITHSINGVNHLSGHSFLKRAHALPYLQERLKRLVIEFRYGYLQHNFSEILGRRYLLCIVVIQDTYDCILGRRLLSLQSSSKKLLFVSSELKKMNERVQKTIFLNRPKQHLVLGCTCKLYRKGGTLNKLMCDDTSDRFLLVCHLWPELQGDLGTALAVFAYVIIPE